MPEFHPSVRVVLWEKALMTGKRAVWRNHKGSCCKNAFGRCKSLSYFRLIAVHIFFALVSFLSSQMRRGILLWLYCVYLFSCKLLGCEYFTMGEKRERIRNFLALGLSVPFFLLGIARSSRTIFHFAAGPKLHKRITHIRKQKLLCTHSLEPGTKCCLIRWELKRFKYLWLCLFV